MPNAETFPSLQFSHDFPLQTPGKWNTATAPLFRGCYWWRASANEMQDSVRQRACALVEKRRRHCRRRCRAENFPLLRKTEAEHQRPKANNGCRALYTRTTRSNAISLALYVCLCSANSDAGSDVAAAGRRNLHAPKNRVNYIDSFAMKLGSLK